LAQTLARRIRRPYVVYAYGQEVWRARPTGSRLLDMRLRGRALARAEALLTLGTFTSSLLAEWGVSPRKLVAVPFGAEPHPHVPASTNPLMLSVGRLVPRKGIDNVIRALPQILRAVPETRYVVVGTGPDEFRLRHLAEQSGVAEKITFAGRLPQADLDALYRECTLFVLPSRREAGELEGLGLVYLEAAAWGRPSLAGRSGGEVDAVVEGVTGRLVDGTSIAEIAAAATALLSSPDTLRQMGEAARRRVEEVHNWSNAARTVDATLARVVATYGRA
jgi:phosphatidylinositol alpha-1,6-mannosyltransferase